MARDAWRRVEHRHETLTGGVFSSLILDVYAANRRESRGRPQFTGITGWRGTFTPRDDRQRERAAARRRSPRPPRRRRLGSSWDAPRPPRRCRGPTAPRIGDPPSGRAAPRTGRVSPPAEIARGPPP